MINVSVDVSELKSFVQNLPQIKDQIFELMQLDIRKASSEYLGMLMNMELALFLGRDRYERKGSVSTTSRNYRNGFYQRTFAMKNIGDLSIRVPRDRLGEFKTNVLPKYDRIDSAIKSDAVLMYFLGMSTRSLSLISTRLFGRKISHSLLSQHSAELHEKVEGWRVRPITDEIKYLYVDGTYFTMRTTDSIEKVCVLVVIGVDKNGHKHIIALQAGDKESASNWRELFKDLKKRGLDGSKVELGIMDGLAGLEKVFLEEFKNSKVQRCQVHLARNVLAKCPHKIKQEVADDLRSIFYASSKKKAEGFYKVFETKWAKEVPSAFKSLETNLENALTFMSFPEAEWLALRTTNPIERLNKEFKRRTKTMEIVAGEKSCYSLLAVVSIRMEAYWKKHPITFQKRLPWFKVPAESTQ
jgi:putative transposase